MTSGAVAAREEKGAPCTPQAHCSWPLCLVVRPGPEPAFWLRVVADAEPVEIDLDVINAVVLLLAERIPVTVTDLDHDPWQATIDHLLTDRST